MAIRNPISLPLGFVRSSCAGHGHEQNSDYILFMLPIKYISDKYGDSRSPRLRHRSRRARFEGMFALKGESDIGDKINTGFIPR